MAGTVGTGRCKPESQGTQSEPNEAARTYMLKGRVFKEGGVPGKSKYKKCSRAEQAYR